MTKRKNKFEYILSVLLSALLDTSPPFPSCKVSVNIRDNKQVVSKRANKEKSMRRLHAVGFALTCGLAYQAISTPLWYAIPSTYSSQGLRDGAGCGLACGTGVGCGLDYEIKYGKVQRGSDSSPPYHDDT